MSLTSRDTLIALLAGASTSSRRVSLMTRFLPGALNSMVAGCPASVAEGQKGRHSWASIELRVVIRWTSCSQTICQKDITVFSMGCWDMMNSRRSKKPGRKKIGKLCQKMRSNLLCEEHFEYAL